MTIKKNNTKFIDAFAEQIFEQTYKFGEEDINDLQHRIAETLASVEEDKGYWTQKFNEILEDFKFVPGGRIMSNSTLR